MNNPFRNSIVALLLSVTVLCLGLQSTPVRAHGVHGCEISGWGIVGGRCFAVGFVSGEGAPIIHLSFPSGLGSSFAQASGIRDLWHHDSTPVRVFPEGEGVWLWFAVENYGIGFITMQWDENHIETGVHPATGYMVEAEMKDGTLHIRTRDRWGKPYEVNIHRSGRTTILKW